jgi:radical SAM superfamily enzyme YgiQ (UPF0313 family)
VTECDRTVVEEILAHQVDPGSIVKSWRPLRDLPLVAEREPEIRISAMADGHQGRMTTIALVSSLGCPYDCDFCSEWRTPYLPFEADRLREELGHIAKRYPKALIAFHDPNFGVRFDETLSAFHGAPAGRRNPFVIESTLSLLNKPRLERLREAGCVMVAPGIESWADYSRKTKTTRCSGEAKYDAISAKMRDIAANIPTVQANVILGVDADAGDEPFDLTARFIAEHETVWTNVNIPIPFGETPFAEHVRREGRLVEGLPHSFYCAPYIAMRPRSYEIPDYLARLIRIYEAMVAPGLLLRRLRAIPFRLGKGVAIARTLALRTELGELRRFHRALTRDTDLQRFYEPGTAVPLPEFFVRRLKQRLGRYAGVLPVESFTPWCADDSEAVPIQLV